MNFKILSLIQNLLVISNSKQEYLNQYEILAKLQRGKLEGKVF